MVVKRRAGAEINNKELCVAYAKTFSTMGGQTVLEDLKKRFEFEEIWCDNTLQMSKRAGEVGLIRFIDKRIAKGLEQ